MNKSKYVISSIAGIIALLQIWRFLPRIEISLKYASSDAVLRGLLSGFWFVAVLVIVILAVFILQNLISLIFAFIYGEQSAEENKLVRILQKINDVLRAFYQMTGAVMFGGMGAIGLFLPDLEGRDTTVYIVCGVFVVFALVMLVLSIRSMICSIRR